MTILDTEKYEVQPTGMEASKQYSDISMTNLFNAHVAILNSERMTIWQRYSAMLIANSFILGFLDRHQPVLFVAIFGLFLCLAWAILTWSGFCLFFSKMDEMHKFVWPGLSPGANPIKSGIAYHEDGDWIYRIAWSVIALFALAYAKLLIWDCIL